MTTTTHDGGGWKHNVQTERTHKGTQASTDWRSLASTAMVLPGNNCQRMFVGELLHLTWILEKYKSLHSEKVQYLAIVIESEEACQIFELVKLLKWLDSIGVKNVCLYDMNVMKGLENHINSVPEGSQVVTNHAHDHMTLEFLSYVDGKEALAKAANLVFVENLKQHPLAGELDAQISLESHLNEALQIVGSKGPEPDLLLVYGPVRSHLGFPAWRLRYTEIV
ncbi:hypothetical protein V8G54_008862 [Vigna mungo]|uniref:ditrans,polycis-polyprenyl diphosphate synthase [(2E,6E)-farnesyldiphosphate specific] n=1 Tax=Vigna mungo TaxID=3915 RepID=A0AAQ3P4M5_VIGMU